ncbi:MAG: putative redox-active protein (C_GCAxxG_C_C) [Firmicutes bacterium ADurb.Bin373]|nr:MAG: putative redox-active protein (C_GCAxxG_C_C) [Firmicutes bacterium ADurb.Bin373]
MFRSLSEMVEGGESIDYHLAAGFGGGLGGSGYVCGAVAAATMVISLEGRGKEKKEIYRDVNGFLNDFQSRFGEINCRGLLGVDLKTKEGLAFLASEGRKKCAEYVRYAADRVSEMIRGKE